VSWHENVACFPGTGGILEGIQRLYQHRNHTSEGAEGSAALRHSALRLGGFAVQEHGYPRFTVDVNIIVPDVELAREKLSMNGFRANPGSTMTVTDRETKDLSRNNRSLWSRLGNSPCRY
jgi:hypothetical protein